MPGKRERKNNTVETVTALVQPLLAQQGLTLWDLRFEKEGAGWYLRVFIDKEGGVTIDDCERFSRAASDLLDAADPIEQSYLFEVCSPGIERELTRPWHFEVCAGKEVMVRLIRPVEGVRDFTGTLQGLRDGVVSLLLDEETEMEFRREEAAFIRLMDEQESGGEF